ncbi:SH2 motif and Tyrosine protein kinase domain containing protein [Aphelenchoides besseyi]|nr:SH2 motif and Tyrosine protein kinase domain containing protein [Aphelenchoides besseyi]
MPVDTSTDASKDGESEDLGWKVLPKGLKSATYYFGFLPREAVEELLENDGDYAVWGQEQEGGALWCYILAVQTKTGKVRHLNLNLSDRKPVWTVELMQDASIYQFPTIPKLIYVLHHKADGISFTDGSDTVKLIKRIKRHFCNIVSGTLATLQNVKKVAIKAVKDAMPDTSEDQIAKNQKAIYMEAKILSNLNHPNIVTFLGIDCFRPPIKLVMEFCPGRSLLVHMQRQSVEISVGEQLLYIFEVARGMHYLEQKEIIHRDLLACNCLISIDSTIKIADFGLSITKKAAEHENCQQLRVSIRHMAPESIGRQAYFSSKSDVWSYGMFIWEVFTDGQKPWSDETVKTIVENIKAHKMPTLPVNTPREVAKVVASCWERDDVKRPSFRQLAEITSKLVQDPKFALPTITDRTICRYNLQPRKSDDFKIEPAIKDSPRSIDVRTDAKHLKEGRRRKRRETRKVVWGRRTQQ